MNNDFKAKDFTYIKIESDDANLEDVLRFSGVAEKDIPNEMVFHKEGDSFKIKGKQVYEYEGHYVVKWADGSCELVFESELTRFLDKEPEIIYSVFYGDHTLPFVTTIKKLDFVLTDEKFLDVYGDYFQQGITGLKFSEPRKDGSIELTIQYWAFTSEYEETTMMLIPVQVFS